MNGDILIFDINPVGSYGLVKLTEVAIVTLAVLAARRELGYATNTLSMQSAGRRESREESNVTMRIPFTGSGEECRSSVSHNIVEGEAIGSIPEPRVSRRSWPGCFPRGVGRTAQAYYCGRSVWGKGVKGRRKR